MAHPHTSARIALAALLLSAVGCASGKRTIHIPESVVPNPATRERVRSAVEPYVIKMSDGRRTWQIEIPAYDATGAFQAVIPLDLASTAAPPVAPPTEADREVKASTPPAPETAGGPLTGSGPAEAPGAAPRATPGRSYLATLARVNELFRRRQYELALIDLVALDREYPDDERILEMKGTLYWKLGRRDLARDAWERVLALNPDNTAVAQALESLLGE